MAPVGRFGGHGSGKRGRADKAQVEGRHAGLGKAERGKIDLAGHLCEFSSGDFVDVEARQALDLAVALLARSST